ncbi:E3 ubiquitin protein ligase [Candidatus Babeliales bacterium]|nr:E3 ubiquitin protein ligase [Candidatus Babeliales bacterium]
MILQKKWLIPAIAFATCTAQVHGIMVSSFNVRDRVTEIARQFLQAQGFPVNTIPTRIAPEYYTKIDDTVQFLNNRMSAQGRSYVDLEEVQEAVRTNLRELVGTLRTLVKSADLARRADEVIKRVTREAGINPDTMAAAHVAEYHRRGEAVVSRMRAIMAQDGRDYVREKEIEDETSREMKAFFARINGRPNTSWESTTSSTNSTNREREGGVFDWLNFLFGGNDQPTTPPPPPANVVNNLQLDNKVLEIAGNILRNNGIDPNNVPARAVSDYSDAIQAIIRTVKGQMNYQGTTTTETIASVAGQALVTVINKIKFIGEICVVCQDNYQRSETVGTLNCGHGYHTDCIAAWLYNNPSCPLCRQQFVYIASRELVP